MTKETPKESEELRYRSLAASDADVNEEARTFRFPVVSDAPVEMYRGLFEVLSHEHGAMRTGDRQRSMPLLFNHDWDRLLGVVDGIEQDEHRTYIRARFAKTEEGSRALELVKDRVLVNVSVGYRVFAWDKPDEQTRRATDWEIFEVSLVTVPADPSVGVYRSLSKQQKEEGNTMPEEKKMMQPEQVKDETRALKVDANPAEIRVNEDQVRSAERARIRGIERVCVDFCV